MGNTPLHVKLLECRHLIEQPGPFFSVTPGSLAVRWFASVRPHHCLLLVYGRCRCNCLCSLTKHLNSFSITMSKSPCSKDDTEAVPPPVTSKLFSWNVECVKNVFFMGKVMGFNSVKVSRKSSWSQDHWLNPCSCTISVHGAGVNSQSIQSKLFVILSVTSRSKTHF